jgi:hypothetical protein
MATVAKSVNMASPSADKINGWEDKVEGVPAELCAIGFGQRCNDDGSCMRQGRSGDDGACVRFGLERARERQRRKWRSFWRRGALEALLDLTGGPMASVQTP